MHLPQPTLDFDDNKCRCSLLFQGDAYTLLVNREGLLDICWSLWWLATKSPLTEDTDLWYNAPRQLPNAAEPVLYAEVSVVSEKDSDRTAPEMRRRTTTVHTTTDTGMTAATGWNLDVFLNRREAVQAFQAMQAVRKVGDRVQLWPGFSVEVRRADFWPLGEN